ncbi:transmembrane protein 42-like [Leucoraja erinacea]|uniref:transmembrane protein 42-like n=1 Tax=Leucoraja erinaceus TaxID=7782 RepID=UPI0024544B70|nr:transmembrane protein 42-like [Leucoraja erinacea]
MSGLREALGAGALGAAAAASAKLWLGGGSGPGPGPLHALRWLGCGGLVVLCNALMWTLFAKALRYSSSSRTTLTTTASNFLSSACLGKLLFGEEHGLLWWLGMALSLAGLLLLHTATDTEQAGAYTKEE